MYIIYMDIYIQKFFGIIKGSIWNYNLIVTIVKTELLLKI